MPSESDANGSNNHHLERLSKVEVAVESLASTFQNFLRTYADDRRSDAEARKQLHLDLQAIGTAANRPVNVSALVGVLALVVTIVIAYSTMVTAPINAENVAQQQRIQAIESQLPEVTQRFENAAYFRGQTDARLQHLERHKP